MTESVQISDAQEAWKKTLLCQNSSIKDAISCLDASSLRIVIVIDKQGIFEGTISDGDIRRGLLKGLNLESSIESVIHRNAVVVPPSFGREIVMQLMYSNQLQQIPVVDNQQCVVGLHVWNEITTTPRRENLMVIMAGGKGTRLMPHTQNCPKPMVLVAGKPMLQHIIERSQQEGFNHFILAINYLGHMIEEYFGDGSRFGVKIDYLREQTSLGTVGALTLFARRPETPFVASYLIFMSVMMPLQLWRSESMNGSIHLVLCKSMVSIFSASKRSQLPELISMLGFMHCLRML
jgi:hypothetical protein